MSTAAVMSKLLVHLPKNARFDVSHQAKNLYESRLRGPCMEVWNLFLDLQDHWGTLTKDLTFGLFIMDTLHKMHVPHIVSQWMRVEHGSIWKPCFERLNKLITISLVTRQHVVKEHWHVLIFWSEHLHQRFVLGGISNLQGRFHWQKLRSIACGNVSYRYLMLMVGRDHFILMHQIVSLLSETVSECDSIFLHFMQS